MENIDNENQVEESYEEEIMVEVVGSDVFVDGVSGQKEGDFGIGEVGDLEVHVLENREETGTGNFREAIDVSSEGDGNKVQELEVGLLESKGRQKHVVEEVDVMLSESVDVGGNAVSELPSRGVVVSDDEAWNPRIAAVAELSPATTESMSGQTQEVMERSSVVVSQERAIKDESVVKDSANQETPELLNLPVEAVIGGELGVANKEAALSSGDNASSHDQLVADSSVTTKATNAAAADQVASSEVTLNPDFEGHNNDRVDRTDEFDLEVGLDNVSAAYAVDHTQIDSSHSEAMNCTVSASDLGTPTSGGEVLISGSSEDAGFRVNAESGSTNSDTGIDAKVGDEKEVLAAQCTDSIPKSDSLLSDVQDENHGSLKGVHGIRCEAANGTNGVSLASLESIHEQSFVGESGDVMDVDLVDVLDFRDGASDINLQDLSCVSKNELLKVDEDSVSDVVFSDEPTHAADGVDIAEINKDKGLKIETQGDTDNNVAWEDSVVSAESGLNNLVEKTISHKEQEVSLQITETRGIHKLESMDVIPNEVAADSDINHVNILAEKTEKAELHVFGTNISLLDGGDTAENWVTDVATPKHEVNISRAAETISSKSNGDHIKEGNTSETKPTNVAEEKEFDQKYNGGEEVDFKEPELGTLGPVFETEKSQSPSEEPVKSMSSLRMNQSGYFSPPENEGQFSPSDLVWGKVRSHPWWPGQIFDPADASEKAVKYYKKDSYLVAYFGDRTFAWNDASVLKPFRSHFPQIEKQSNSEVFQNAVNSALEEVSRRVELGLACSCTPKDAYGKIETQVVENTGIREESSRRYGLDQSSRPSSFEPDKLLQFVRDLAPCASSGADRLDLVIARAQLSAFFRFKGFHLPTGFASPGELLENDADTEPIGIEKVASHKRKHTPKDSLQPRKERSLTELMGDTAYSTDSGDDLVAKDPSKSVSLSSGKKQKALDPLADGSDKRVGINAAKVSTSTNQTPKPSFKIGECIRRVASQLTGSTSMVKGHDDDMGTVGSPGSPIMNEQSERRSMVVSAESSLNEMLSELQLVAQDPKKKNNSLNTIITFFSGFRSSIALNRQGRKKKADTGMGGSAEEFEFDDINDSYWTDRIVHNYSEEQLLHSSENGTGNLQLVPFDAEKSLKSGRKSHSRKRFSSGNYPTEATELEETVKRRKQESSPAELIMNFAERVCIPTEINLNKMFRRFGPLMESETEVDHDAGRAKVIFKRGSDAEVAQNSAEKFNIFGPVLVNYQIGYTPLISVKILPLAMPPRQEDATLML